MTIALYVSEEMCARMGVVTGKGLSDLIREEFGFRSTFFVMVAGAGRRPGQYRRRVCRRAQPSMQIFGVSKYISVPLAGLPCGCWWCSGTYQPGGENISGGLRLLSLLRALGVSGQAGLAASREGNCDSFAALQCAAIC